MVQNSNEAQKVVEELLQSGFDRRQIGTVSSDVLRETAAAVGGASTGMAIGGVAGLLLAAAAIAIPGIGPVVAAGPALTLLGGTVAGAVTGGLIGGLKSKGVPEEDAHFFAEGLRRGGTLITVHAENDELAERAVETLKRHGAIDMSERAAQWRKSGWTGRFLERDTSAAAGNKAAPAAPSAPASSPASPAAPRRESATPAVAQSFAPQASGPVRTASDVPLEAQRTRSDEEPILAAVQVYSFVIEMPGEGALDTGQTHRSGRPANQPKYGGPERRRRNVPFSGADRRHAA
jgi:hypothetical protein